MTSKRTRKQTNILHEALRQFTQKGFYNTKISEISRNLGVSVGSIYNYFPSKKMLAKAAIRYVSGRLASELRYINNQDLPMCKKVLSFTRVYFHFVRKNPEMIEYFFRVYLSNREIFKEDEDGGFALASEFLGEIKVLMGDHYTSEEEFFVFFSLICGTLGAMTFLCGEGVLGRDLEEYSQTLARHICRSIGAECCAQEMGPPQTKGDRDC